MSCVWHLSEGKECVCVYPIQHRPEDYFWEFASTPKPPSIGLLDFDPHKFEG